MYIAQFSQNSQAIATYGKNNEEELIFSISIAIVRKRAFAKLSA